MKKKHTHMYHTFAGFSNPWHTLSTAALKCSNFTTPEPARAAIRPAVAHTLATSAPVMYGVSYR